MDMRGTQSTSPELMHEFMIKIDRKVILDGQISVERSSDRDAEVPRPRREDRQAKNIWKLLGIVEGWSGVRQH